MNEQYNVLTLLSVLERLEAKGLDWLKSASEDDQQAVIEVLDAMKEEGPMALIGGLGLLGLGYLYKIAHTECTK